MIGRQLDLFGGPPKPPKKIVIEEEPVIPEPAVEAEPSTDLGEKMVGPEEDAGLPAQQAIHVQMPSLPEEKPVGTVEVSLIAEPETENPAGSTASTAAGENEQEGLAPELPDSEEPGFVSAGLSHMPDEDVEDGYSPLPDQQVADETDTFASAEAAPVSWDNQTALPEEENFDLDTPPDHPDFEETMLPDSETGLSGDEGLISATEETETETEAIPEPALVDETITENTVDEPAEGGPLNIPADNALYSRQYYTMRETAAMFNVNQSLLRFWENEFDILKPKKNRKGDRYFRPDDIKNLELIYHLLRVRKFTISGAKDYLKNRAKSLDTFAMVQRLEKLKLFLQELKTHA